MYTNADITIYNRKFQKDTRLDEWYRTVIRGVYFYVDNKVSVGDNGLNSADVYKIRIPEDAKCESVYIPEHEYANMVNPKGYWTLQEGDYIVNGACVMDISKPADLEGLRKCKILSWSDNRHGRLPHWRVGGN